MAKIIILGADGQLGSDLVKVLADSSHQVVPLTRDNFDALDSLAVSKFEQYGDIDYIINCVAVTNVDGCEDNVYDAFSINTSFALKLAMFCAAHDITLVHLSTDYVFDGNKTTPYQEDDLAAPLNIYGLSKYAAEVGIATYTTKYFILRVSSLFGVAGAAGKGGNFVTTMLRLASEKDSWTVIDDQITCPTHTLDIARAIVALINQQVTEYGIYNCVSSSSCSWYQFTQDILTMRGFDKNKVQPISYREYKFKALRPQYGVMAVDKLAKYYQMPTYQAALKEYLDLKFAE